VRCRKNKQNWLLAPQKLIIAFHRKETQTKEYRAHEKIDETFCICILFQKKFKCYRAKFGRVKGTPLF